MPCEVYELLHKDLVTAVHRHALALDRGSQRARTMSIKQRILEETGAKRELVQAEHKYNTHVVSCAQCKNDRRTEFRIARVKE
jgi:hypothetical protein